MEKSPKQYVYHIVPAHGIREDDDGRKRLHPLSVLQEKFPDLFNVELEKYAGSDERINIPEKIIPTLDRAAWSEVLNLTAIHPKDLKKELKAAGFDPHEYKFYQIDADLLDPEKATVYLYRTDIDDEHLENYAPFDPAALHEHARATDTTRRHYAHKRKRNEKPLLFVGIPHIFYNGSIDVTDLPVIVA